MSSTKRLKHISMMLLWDDVDYIEKELCHSHGDLSHIFRNVFHNFVEQMRISKQKSETLTKEKESLNDNNTTNSKSPSKVKSKKAKTKKSKPNRAKKL